MDILKKGLDMLKWQVNTKKTKLEELQWKGNKLSEADTEWLDHKGNVVEEQVLLDKLEAASDYERAFGKLSDTGKALVQKLWELAGDISKVIGKKWKGMPSHFLHHIQAETEPCL